MRNKKKKQGQEFGFTLVELVVAAGIFSIAIVFIVGLFIQATRAQRMVNSLMSSNNNMSLVMEQVAREIRTGYDFMVDDAIPSSCGLYKSAELFDSLSFVRAKGNSTTTIVYRWDNMKKTLERKEGDEDFTVITAGDIFVERFCFLMGDTIPNDTRVDPWRVTMFLKIGSRDRQLKGREVNLQTTISPRILPREIK